MGFKISDTIEVINPGQIYSTYLDMAEILGADIDGRWIERGIVDGVAIINEIGRILNISKDGSYILIQLFDTGEQWIISPKGLKQKTDFNYLPEELFEV